MLVPRRKDLSYCTSYQLKFYVAGSLSPSLVYPKMGTLMWPRLASLRRFVLSRLLPQIPTPKSAQWVLF